MEQDDRTAELLAIIYRVLIDLLGGRPPGRIPGINVPVKIGNSDIGQIFE